jgi:dCMP deaminase
MKKCLLLHIPVLHEGYIDLFEKYSFQIKKLYVVDEGLSSEFSEYKEIRSVSSKILVKMIKSLGFPFSVGLITCKNIKSLKNTDLIVGDDPITSNLLKKYFPNKKYDLDNVYLRWHEGNVQSPHVPHYDFETESVFDKKMMSKAIEVGGGNSTDWWRRVGCVVVKNKKIILTSFNAHFPDNDTQYIDGDPRDFVKAGELGFLASSAHAEQMAIALAAQKGKSLKGCDMYVSTYPCPTCAKLMATAGVKRCFFMGGNAYLDVEKVLKATGLKAILVKGI